MRLIKGCCHVVLIAVLFQALGMRALWADAEEDWSRYPEFVMPMLQGAPDIDGYVEYNEWAGSVRLPPLLRLDQMGFSDPEVKGPVCLQSWQTTFKILISYTRGVEHWSTACFYTVRYL